MSTNSIYKSEDGRRAVEAWCLRELGRFEVDVDHRTVSTSLGESHVISAGVKKGSSAVVLIPGTNHSAAHWRTVIEALAPQVSVYAVDLAGQPGMSSTQRPSFTERDVWSKWVAEVLDGLELDRAVIVGHSLGGWVSLNFAAVFPERVVGVVPICPAGFVKLGVGFDAMWKSMLWLMKPSEKGSRRLLEMMSEPGAEVDEASVEWQTLVARHVRSSFAPPPLPDEELGAVQAPVRLIVAELDVFLPGEKVAAAAQKKLNTLREPLIVMGAGHLLPHDRPALVADHIREFTHSLSRP